MKPQCLSSRLRVQVFLASVLLLALFLLACAKTAAYGQEPAKPRQIAVLVYHEVLPAPGGSDQGNPSVIRLDQFASQMEYLNRYGYFTASMKDLGDYVTGRRSLPEKTVVITFDDGYESNGLYCYPYLARYGFRAAIFMVGSLPEKSRPHLTALQVVNMVRSGLVEIGSHTYGNHRFVDGVPALSSLPQSEVKKDFLKFNDLCLKIGIPAPRAVAYPYGNGGPEVHAAAAEAGYRLGFSVERGFVRVGDNPMSLKRFSIRPDMDMSEFARIVSGLADG